MKYRSKLPDDSVNIPKESYLLQTLKLFFSLALLAFLSYMILIFVLHTAIDNLPLKYEKKLVQFISFDMEVGEIKSDEYLDEITQKISKCANLTYDVKTYIISQATPNAYALPGGSIYITTGMLKELKNQNELVAILGHEMGHFKNRDHLKTLGSSVLFSLISLSLGDGYGKILETTLNISKIKYSQSAELKSDIFALDVMDCSYGSVSNATELFSRLDKGNEMSFFLATHPPFKKRIKKMQDYIASKNYDITKVPTPFKKEFN